MRRPTRRKILGGLAGSLTIAEAHARGFFGAGGALPVIQKIITGATISPASFVGGAPDGPVVGAVSVQSSGATFVGTGTPIQIAAFGQGADFKLDSSGLPSNLELNGTQAAGSYSIKLTLTDSQFDNSPFTTPAITITGSSSGAVQLSTLTVVNDSASTQTAGTWFLFRGHPFRQSDIPAGTAPQFLVSGVPQPYSWGGQVAWPDGSLKFASFLIRPTFSLNAAGTQAIGVWNGGVAPSTSARGTPARGVCVRPCGQRSGSSRGAARPRGRRGR